MFSAIDQLTGGRIPTPPTQRDIPGNAAPWAAHDGTRVRGAAYRATRLYPGAVGEQLAREIRAAEEIGKALGPSSLMARVVHQVMTTDLPVPPP